MAITLTWDDPEAGPEFLALRRDLRRQGWLGDHARAALLELVASSEVKDSSDGEEGDG